MELPQRPFGFQSTIEGVKDPLRYPHLLGQIVLVGCVARFEDIRSVVLRGELQMYRLPCGPRVEDKSLL